MPNFHFIATFLILTAFYFNPYKTSAFRIKHNATQSPAMCYMSNQSSKGKCTGRMDCTACTTCNYCAYCNNGGLCGVCSGPVLIEPEPFYTPKPQPRKVPLPTPKLPEERSSPSPKNDNDWHPKPFEPIPDFQDVYIVTQETSFRASPDSHAQVLKRFKRGDEVVLIEAPKGYWWKVNFNGKTGWVKKALLRKK